jgi:16S rRNA (guanine(966)-N(2))-methyltransferase RsmD
LIKNKVRIIGGKWRSRIITFADRPGLRPTPDRVRETVFNWLGQDLSGKRCLDLFSGSGAMGLEAASRGAESVTLVEPDSMVLKVLRANLDKLQAADQILLVPMDALGFLKSNRELFDIIFLDPPYGLGLVPELLSRLYPHLSEEGIVYAEGGEFIEPPLNWLVWRKGRAGKVSYQLLKFKRNG